jgi:hypothetical protein
MSFDVTRAIFNQADANRDGGIDRNEFNQWAAGAGAGAGFGGGSSYESSYSSSGYGAGAGLVGGGLAGYESSAAYGSGGYGAGLVGAGGSSYEASSFESSAGYGAGAGVGVVGVGGQAYDASSASFSTQTAVQTYPTDAQGLFLDSNPQIIRRPAAGGVQTYTQNIKVRFLQPPPVPPPGVNYFSLIFLFLSLLKNFYFLATHHQRSAPTSTTCPTSTSHPSTSSTSSSTTSTHPS